MLVPLSLYPSKTRTTAPCVLVPSSKNEWFVLLRGLKFGHDSCDFLRIIRVPSYQFGCMTNPCTLPPPHLFRLNIAAGILKALPDVS